MSRNLKRDYLQKLASITTANGYKIDLSNYIYNPSFDHEYPSFIKADKPNSEGVIKVTSVLFFKHYDGTGEYYKETYTRLADGKEWQVVKDRQTEILHRTIKGERFNIKTLQELTEAIG